jgi:5'(3')-deoxyribonucleotidase
MSKIVYIDMDGVLVDLQSKLDSSGWFKGIFKHLEPIDGAVDAFNYLCNSSKYEVYILSTAPWNMPESWSDKRLWVSKHLGKNAYKKLILSNHKNLCHGDYLIDDRTANGADKFNGELIQFGTDKHPNWESVLKYLKENE